MLWVLRVKTARIALIVLFCIQKYDFLTKFSLDFHVSSLIILVDYMTLSPLLVFVMVLVRAEKNVFEEAE